MTLSIIISHHSHHYLSLFFQARATDIFTWIGLLAVKHFMKWIAERPNQNWNQSDQNCGLEWTAWEGSGQVPIMTLFLRNSLRFPRNKYQVCKPQIIVEDRGVRLNPVTNNVLSVYLTLHTFYRNTLTHWGRDEIDAISQTTFSNAFSWMKMNEFRLGFHWSLFLRVQLTIIQHWFR